MNNNFFIKAALLASSLFIAACSDDASTVEIPQPIAMTQEAVGHYCNMNILEHAGPKAQMFFANNEFPVWFSQVRDAVAYTRMPEETLDPIAIYVNDMAKAKNWNFPEDNTWIDIKTAFFVINSNKNGGMGAPEAIPFGNKASATQFSAEYGGQISRLSEIPDDYVLGPVDINVNNQTVTGAIQ